MNFYDVNVSIGGWPFRHVPRHSACELREDLESMGALGALVTNNGSILYGDTREANLELADAIQAHRGFFYGCATINPVYPHPVEEMELFVERYNFRAIRILPRFHNYEAAAAIPLLQAAAARKIPVLVPYEIVDFRQQNQWEPKTPFSSEEMLKLATAVPEATIVWLFTTLDESAPANVYGEYDRWKATGDLSRLLYGSNMPLRLPGSYCKLETEPIPEVLRQTVAVENFRKLFL